MRTITKNMKSYNSSPSLLLLPELNRLLPLQPALVPLGLLRAGPEREVDAPGVVGAQALALRGGGHVVHEEDDGALVVEADLQAVKVTGESASSSGQEEQEEEGEEWRGQHDYLRTAHFRREKKVCPDLVRSYIRRDCSRACRLLLSDLTCAHGGFPFQNPKQVSGMQVRYASSQHEGRP